MVMRLRPFERASVKDKKYKQLLFLNLADEFWINYSLRTNVVPSDEFKSLVTAMLAYDPVRRPSLIEIINHPWVKSYPVPTQDEIIKEFTERKSKLEDTPGVTTIEDEKLIRKIQKKSLKTKVQKQKEVSNDEGVTINDIPVSKPLYER